MATFSQISPTVKDRWLQSLPEEVYDLDKTSHIVRLLDVLCGEPGVGKVRKQAMLRRLQTTLEATRYTDLDRVYSGVFGIRRLIKEQYPYRESDLLTWVQKQEMEYKDAMYRARIWKYMKSFQYGGTREGIRLASEAALGVECEVVTAAEYYESRGIDHGTPLEKALGQYPVKHVWHADLVTTEPVQWHDGEGELHVAVGVTVDDELAEFRYSDADVSKAALDEALADLAVAQSAYTPAHRELAETVLPGYAEAESAAASAEAAAVASALSAVSSLEYDWRAFPYRNNGATVLAAWGDVLDQIDRDGAYDDDDVRGAAWELGDARGRNWHALAKRLHPSWHERVGAALQSHVDGKVAAGRADAYRAVAPEEFMELNGRTFESVKLPCWDDAPGANSMSARFTVARVDADGWLAGESSFPLAIARATHAVKVVVVENPVRADATWKKGEGIGISVEVRNMCNVVAKSVSVSISIDGAGAKTAYSDLTNDNANRFEYDDGSNSPNVLMRGSYTHELTQAQVGKSDVTFKVSVSVTFADGHKIEPMGTVPDGETDPAVHEWTVSSATIRAGHSNTATIGATSAVSSGAVVEGSSVTAAKLLESYGDEHPVPEGESLVLLVKQVRSAHPGHEEELVDYDGVIVDGALSDEVALTLYDAMDLYLCEESGGMAGKAHELEVESRRLLAAASAVFGAVPLDAENMSYVDAVGGAAESYGYELGEYDVLLEAALSARSQSMDDDSKDHTDWSDRLNGISLLFAEAAERHREHVGAELSYEDMDGSDAMVQAKAARSRYLAAKEEVGKREAEYMESLEQNKTLWWVPGDLSVRRIGKTLRLGWDEKVADYNEYIVIADVGRGDVLADRTFARLDDFYIADGEYRYDDEEDIWEYGWHGDYVVLPGRHGVVYWDPSKYIDAHWSGKALYIEPSDYAIQMEVAEDMVLSEDQVRSFYDVTRRIRPVDARVTLRRKSDVADELHVEAFEREKAGIRSIEASSSWWNVVKFVTGRVDWDYVRLPSSWIEPGVRKEAPRQVLVATQEDSEDFTFLVKNVTASTEHAGYYGAQQQRLFSSLRGYKPLAEASNALSSSVATLYTTGFYGGEDVTDWSYPVEYAQERLTAFEEHARAIRWWSSEEKPAGEEDWVEFEFQRTLPVNRLKVNVCRKPVRMGVQAASMVDEGGDPIWHDVRTSSWNPLSYESASWGGSSVSGFMTAVEFSFPTIRCNRIRLVFERRYIPLISQDPVEGFATEEWFDWSVEVADASFGYDIRSIDDYIDATYIDSYGNLVDTELKIFGPDEVNDGNQDTYWLSQPNVGGDAVEWLVMDVREEDGSASRVNYIIANPIYGGCQMNVYSTEEDEPVNWVPYSGTFELVHGRIDLPYRRAKWMKLEFTDLVPIPYTSVFPDVETQSLVFPAGVRNHFDVQDDDNFEQTYAGKLLRTSNFAYGDLRDAYADLGIQGAYYDIQKVLDGISELEFSDMPFGESGTRYPYRSESEPYNPNSEWENEDVGVGYLSYEHVDYKRRKYRFHEIGPHGYDVAVATRQFQLAYVVGIRDLSFGYDNDLWLCDPGETLMLPMEDSRYIAEVQGWELRNDRRYYPMHAGELNWFETQDMRTILPFRSFDFAANQCPPAEAFLHPSDMASEWHGFGSDVERVEFGVGGKTLRVDMPLEGSSGIESDTVTVLAHSIGSFQVDLFPLEAGRWTVEAVDPSGASVFQMHYDVQARRWNTLGAVFMPEAGGGWWNDDYKYRVTVPLEGPLVKGNDVLVEALDLDLLARAGAVRPDYRDVKAVFFDGARNAEIDCDITGPKEIWLDVQQTLDDGQSADGSYDFVKRRVTGAYFIYFGNPNESSEPKRDWTNLFEKESGVTATENASASPAGVSVNDIGEYVEVPWTLSGNEGSIAFDYTPLTTPQQPGEGEFGSVGTRMLVDYDDDDKRVRIYVRGGQLMVDFFDKRDDGFTSMFASDTLGCFVGNERTTVEVSWGPVGSGSVREYKVVDGEYVPGDIVEYSPRRDIQCAIGFHDGTWRRVGNIHNVYGEHAFEDDGNAETHGSF